VQRTILLSEEGDDAEARRHRRVARPGSLNRNATCSDSATVRPRSTRHPAVGVAVARAAAERKRFTSGRDECSG